MGAKIVSRIMRRRGTGHETNLIIVRGGRGMYLKGPGGKSSLIFTVRYSSWFAEDEGGSGKPGETA